MSARPNRRAHAAAPRCRRGRSDERSVDLAAGIEVVGIDAGDVAQTGHRARHIRCGNPIVMQREAMIDARLERHQAVVWTLIWKPASHHGRIASTIWSGA